jgi:hypothetical protein
MEHSSRPPFLKGPGFLLLFHVYLVIGTYSIWTIEAK